MRVLYNLHIFLGPSLHLVAALDKGFRFANTFSYQFIRPINTWCFHLPIHQYLIHIDHIFNLLSFFYSFNRFRVRLRTALITKIKQSTRKVNKTLELKSKNTYYVLSYLLLLGCICRKIQLFTF